MGCVISRLELRWCIRCTSALAADITEVRPSGVVRSALPLNLAASDFVPATTKSWLVPPPGHAENLGGRDASIASRDRSQQEFRKDRQYRQWRSARRPTALNVDCGLPLGTD